MAVRVRVRIVSLAGAREKAVVETVAVANSGYESDTPGALLPVRLASKLGLWPAPAGARVDRFVSPIGASELMTIPGAVRFSLAGVRDGAVTSDAVIAERETEVVMNDALVEALELDLVAVRRGLYRVGAKGRLRRSAAPRHW
ncbi:MAG: hypothetical protein ACREQ9_21050 [Candidatus Binatia bacterium]